MIDKLLEWRIYTKLRSTYVEALPTLIAGRRPAAHDVPPGRGRDRPPVVVRPEPPEHPDPDRARPADPARVRRRRAGRSCCSPPTTRQIELRILAHVSGDEHLKEAFARQADIHRETAARVLHKDPADVTADERSMAKMVNFGLAYGMSDFGLSSRANIPRQEAQEFINSYFAAYSGISYYMMAIKEQAESQGYVETLLGRSARSRAAARNPALRGAGERMAINMPIQGTAADILKIAMIRLDGAAARPGLHARLLLRSTTSCCSRSPRDEVERLARVVRETMEGALPLDVPLRST